MPSDNASGNTLRKRVHNTVDSYLALTLLLVPSSPSSLPFLNEPLSPSNLQKKEDSESEYEDDDESGSDGDESGSEESDWDDDESEEGTCVRQC